MRNKKGRRSRNKATGNEEAACSKGNGDRLSKLPNDLLLNILERVDTFDALKACILSKQFLNLPAMLSQIDIDVGCLVRRHDNSRRFCFRDVVRNNGAVVQVTDDILSRRSPGIAIRKLVVRMVLMRYDLLSVGKSFAHAMATHKVEKAEIEIVTEKPCQHCKPEDLLAYAKRFNIVLGDCVVAFAGLTRLWLQNMRFDRSLVLSQLLANFPSITELHLDFQSEKIWVLLECPELLAPVLGKLRLVNLDNLPEGCDIAWTMFILEAAPVLEELSITVWDHWCDMVTDKELRKSAGYCDKSDKSNVEWKPSSCDFKHKNLAKLTIYGFQADDDFIRYIKRVMVAAVNMKEVSLHDRKVCEYCSDLDPNTRYPQTDEERKHVIKELGMVGPAVVHFRS